MISKTSTDDLSLLLGRGRARAGEKAVYVRWSPDGTEQRELGYREACARIDRVGAQFNTWGLVPGAYVLVASADDQALATVFLACLSYGVVAMVVDHHAKPAEVAALLAIQRPDAVIVDHHLSTLWPAADIERRLVIGGAPRSSLTSRLLRRSAPVVDHQPRFPETIDALAPAVPPVGLDPELDAYVLFTSGSTSRPKGVGISRRALAAHTRTLIARWGYDHSSRILDILPLHHTDGLIQGIFCTWASGGMCVRSGPFRVDAIARLLVDPIYRDRITHLIAVPTMLALLLRYARDETDAFRQPSFRFIISAAGYLDEHLWREFEQRFTVRVCNIYGLTETVTGGCFAGPDDQSHVIGSVGVAVDCEVKVVGEDGNDVGVELPGELLMRGQHLMRGYLNDRGNESAMVDGWLRTGDLATIDGAGVVRIVGRKKNLVISGGLNIQPEEVAEVLRTLPGIADAVAFGISDPAFTEVLVACVVATESGTSLDIQALIQGCQSRLSAFKVPKTVVQLPAFPYGPSGKVLVPRVRELFLHACAARTRGGTGDVHSRVFAVAAEAFHLPIGRLTAADAPGRTPGWDSFAHLAFIAGLEAAFSLHLSTADIMAIRTLGDAERILREAMRG